jgi:uncharacterized protein (TIGR03032 family)
MHGYYSDEGPRIHVVAAPRSGARRLAALLTHAPAVRTGGGSVDAEPGAALRVAALAGASPDARFAFVLRDVREALSSMLDAWRSGSHVIHPQPPGWTGPPWSLPVVPGWEGLLGSDLVEIVAHQWASTTTAVLDGLDALPADRWCVASYDRLLREPAAEAARVARFVGLGWDDEAERAAAAAATATTSPDPAVWRRNTAEVERALPLVAAVVDRAQDLFARPPASRPARPPTTSDRTTPAGTEPDDHDGGFRSVHTASLPVLLSELQLTLFVSTYQSGRLIAVRADGDELNTHFRTFASPMGIAVDPRRLVVGTRTGVWEHRNQPAVAARRDPPGRHDAAYVPRSLHVTGDIQVHELADVAGELWMVATRFSCLATLDRDHSFVPRWRPPFVRELAAEDRCHLNGMAVADGAVRYVTAMGQTDTAGGWRDHKVDGGVVLDVPSGEVVTAGLSMPHSPRVVDGRLWVLSSGRGEVCTVDVATGAREVVAKLPGFTRGLAFAGGLAFVGLSQVRESVFGGIPLAEDLPADERRCGVWVLDARTGETVAFLQFEGAVQEIFDVQVLPGIAWPELAEADSELTAGSFVLPDAAMADVHQPRP